LVYATYYDLLGAARARDGEALKTAFARLPELAIDAKPFHTLRWGDPAFEAKRADRFLHYVNNDTSNVVHFDEVDVPVYDHACTLAHAAVDMFDVAAPEIAGEATELIRELVFVSNSTGKGRGFDGATSFYCWGALFLNAEGHQTLVDMIDGLAHESAHAHLFGIASGAPLVTNPPEERYTSPLRSDPRPLEGIFHATFVSARMYYAHARLFDAGAYSSEQADQAEESSDLARQAFYAGLSTLDAHAKLTSLGRRVIKAASAYMAQR
jgi:HEXXH motif-containing protein